MSSRAIRWCIAGVLLLTLAVPLGCGGDLPQGAIAVVGQVSITQEAFDDLKAAYESAGRAPVDGSSDSDVRRFEQGVAEYLVTMEVLNQRASQYKVTVSEQDVQAEITKLRDMFMDSEERFEEALDKQGLTLQVLTDFLRENLLLERMKSAVTEDLTVTEAEAKAYYEAHESDYVNQEQRETRHILISPYPAGEEGTVTASQTDWEAAKAEADKVRAQIQNGSEFSTQAQKYSDDETTRENGGELGVIVRGQMVPAFEEAVFSLKKGEISLPIRTQYGYHIIEVTDIIPEEQLSYDEVSEGIKSALLERKRDEAWSSWLLQQETALGVEYADGLKPERTTTTSTTESTTTSTSEEE